MKKGAPPVPDDLAISDKHRLVEWVQVEARIDRRYKRFCTPDALRHVVGETLDFHRARGNSAGYRDWLAVIKNRIRALATEGEFWVERRKREEVLELPDTVAEELLDFTAPGEQQISIAPIIEMLTGKKRA